MEKIKNPNRAINVQRNVGPLCSKCKIPTDRHSHPKGFIPEPGRGWYRYWHVCPRCKERIIDPDAYQHDDPNRRLLTLAGIVYFRDPDAVTFEDTDSSLTITIDKSKTELAKSS